MRSPKLSPSSGDCETTEEPKRDRTLAEKERSGEKSMGIHERAGSQITRGHGGETPGERERERSRERSHWVPVRFLWKNVSCTSYPATAQNDPAQDKTTTRSSKRERRPSLSKCNPRAGWEARAESENMTINYVLFFTKKLA